jgi:hypothetical protein
VSTVTMSDAVAWKLLTGALANPAREVQVEGDEELTATFLSARSIII